MSTYLVAFVIGELGSVARECGTDFGTVPLHVWSTPDKWVIDVCRMLE